jgi:hypothetical protein
MILYFRALVLFYIYYKIFMNESFRIWMVVKTWGIMLKITALNIKNQKRIYHEIANKAKVQMKIILEKYSHRKLLKKLDIYLWKGNLKK